MFEPRSRSESCPRRPTRMGVRSACPTLPTVGVSTPQSVTLRAFHPGTGRFIPSSISFHFFSDLEAFPRRERGSYRRLARLLREMTGRIFDDALHDTPVTTFSQPIDHSSLVQQNRRHKGIRSGNQWPPSRALGDKLVLSHFAVQLGLQPDP